MLGPSGLAQSEQRPGGSRRTPAAEEACAQGSASTKHTQRRRPTTSRPTSRRPPTKDDNAFPEAVSRQAAEEAGNTSGETPDTPKKPTARRNLRRTIIHSPRTFLAKLPRMFRRLPNRLPTAPPRSDLPPGVSSSSSSSSGPDLGEPGTALPQEPDPARAKKDIDVGELLP